MSCLRLLSPDRIKLSCDQHVSCHSGCTYLILTTTTNFINIALSNSMTSVASAALPLTVAVATTSVSPLQLQSGWLMSKAVLAMQFSTSFVHNFDHALSIHSSYQKLGLHILIVTNKEPPYYQSVLTILDKLANTLDAHDLLREPYLQVYFFPVSTSCRSLRQNSAPARQSWPLGGQTRTRFGSRTPK